MDLMELVSLFHASREELARFAKVEPGDAPPDYQRLLLHEEHMTVAVEAYYESLVKVEVLNTRVTPTHYAREILLRRQTDDAVVQYGIMRIDMRQVSPTIRDEIERQGRPLGRILVRYNVLRTIHLHSLWRVEPGAALQRCLGLTGPTITYGRTAGIDLDGAPAVELLEILAPLAQ